MTENNRKEKHMMVNASREMLGNILQFSNHEGLRLIALAMFPYFQVLFSQIAFQLATNHKNNC